MQKKELFDLSNDHDVLFSGWCNNIVKLWSDHFPQKKIITYLRRYELWDDNIRRIDFKNVHAVIFLNEFFQKTFTRILRDNQPRSKWLIRNGIDLDEFPLRESVPHTNGSIKIAMVASIREIKNFPLAIQILAGLPSNYKIHSLGIFTDPYHANSLLAYADYLGVLNRFIFYDKIPREAVPKWLEDKHFILSTSINEGNPNNVLEAMAMGIKPIIHAWPGAYEQFPREYIFRTVSEAVKMIKFSFGSLSYNPEKYRQWIEVHYSLNNIEKLREVIES